MEILEENFSIRLQRLIDALGLKPNQFAKEIGFERPQGIYNVLEGTSKGLNSTTLGAIIERYPNINLSWLIAGMGSMFHDDNTSVSPVTTQRLIDERDIEIKNLKNELLKAEGRIDGYQEMLAGFIKFRPTLDEEKLKEKVKTAGFKRAPEGARIMHLNFNTNTKKYDTSEVQINKIGFVPMWKELQNASRA